MTMVLLRLDLFDGRANIVFGKAGPFGPRLSFARFHPKSLFSFAKVISLESTEKPRHLSW